MKRVVFQHKNNIAIMALSPYDNAHSNDEALSDEKLMLRAQKEIHKLYDAGILENKHPFISLIEADDLPKLFYDAWELKKDKVTINMDKARKCHMDSLRKLRDDKWKNLDEQYIRALENDDVKARKKIITKKNQLRDMPKTFDLSKYKTPEELIKARPDYL